MIKFLLKSFVYLGIVAVGAYFAVTRIPSLKANIIEYANPRVKETRLLNELQSDIEKTGTARAKALVKEISAINAGTTGIIPTIVTKVTDAASAIAPLLPAAITSHLPAGLFPVSSPGPSCPVR